MVSGTKAAPHPRITSAWWSPAWIPIVSSGSGHLICVDTAPPARGKPGQVILFLHDDGERFCLAGSFQRWLSAIADGLEQDVFGWDASAQELSDQAFLAIALEGRDLYKPKAKKRRR